MHLVSVPPPRALALPWALRTSLTTLAAQQPVQEELPQ